LHEEAKIIKDSFSKKNKNYVLARLVLGGVYGIYGKKEIEEYSNNQNKTKSWYSDNYMRISIFC